MRRNFDFRDPKIVLRTLLGVLAAANLVAAALVLFPPGGSAETLERERASLSTQLATRRTVLQQTRQHAEAVDKGRAEGDEFLNQYFLSNRTAFSTLLSDLDEVAKKSQIKPRDNAYALEPIEGSDNLDMMSITAAFEGKYADLMKFVNAIDKLHRLLIIESLSAAPQQNSEILSVSMKLNTFVREGQTREAASR